MIKYDFVFNWVCFFFLLCLLVLVQQPLVFSGFLLCLSFLSSIYISLFCSSWFSLSLFLIYIGGMLVLFGYVMVLVPNFIFSFSSLIYFFLIFFFFSFSYLDGEACLFLFDFSFSFFDFSNFFLFLGIASVLFVGLISVTKICFFQVGALRPFFFYIYV